MNERIHSYHLAAFPATPFSLACFPGPLSILHPVLFADLTSSPSWRSGAFRIGRYPPHLMCFIQSSCWNSHHTLQIPLQRVSRCKAFHSLACPECLRTSQRLDSDGLEQRWLGVGTGSVLQTSLLVYGYGDCYHFVLIKWIVC